MFRGRSKHNLDEKGRLAIPARFREVLEKKNDGCLVLTNQHNCLWAFARDDWRVIEEKAANLSLFDRAVNTYRRYFISGAQECPLKQGTSYSPLSKALCDMFRLQKAYPKHKPDSLRKTAVLGSEGFPNYSRQHQL